MAKSQIRYACQNCGHEQLKWEGKCPSCNEWNTLVKEESAMLIQGGSGKARDLVSLESSGTEISQRLDTGINEFNSVLGGGVVRGSLVLLGGDPGIGKSTLALQSALRMAEGGKKIVYVSGEESVRQVKLRADRLSKSQEVLAICETNLEIILATIEKEKPDLVVVDSVQTLYSSQVNGVVGGVSQIAYSTNSFLKLAKSYHVVVLLIGHVTKEGMLAGPRTLEHMVDVVLYLEGERFETLRLLRCVKNRFGSTGEVGVFEMKEKGLVEIKNPGGIFLEHRTEGVPGTCVTGVLEGNKVLLLEVQALTNPASFGYPKRTASGFDANRLQLLAAIMEKRLGVKLSKMDIYVNVAGGFKLEERAADLPVVLAILSSYKNKPLKKDLVAFGEVGLAGEVRKVQQSVKRLKEAQKLGFKEIVSAANLDESERSSIHSVSFISDLEKFL